MSGNQPNLAARLGGGDRRSVGRADEIAAEIEDGTVSVAAVVALQALVSLAADDPRRSERVRQLLDTAAATGTAAMQAEIGCGRDHGIATEDGQLTFH